MSKRNRSRYNKEKQNKNIIRCKEKMIPVFETDTCEKFEKKAGVENTKICKNCKYSF